MKMLDFPNARQTFEYDCGAKAMHAVLAYYGIDVNENEIIRIAHTNKKSGTSLQGMMAVARHFKLSATMGEMSVQKIKECIGKDIPIILLLQAWAKRKVKNWQNHWNDGHYVVAIGYDKKKIYFEDPYTISHTFLPYKELERRWHGEKRCRIGIVIKGKKKYSSEKSIPMG